jgi:hypothetical protein
MRSVHLHKRAGMMLSLVFIAVMLLPAAVFCQGAQGAEKAYQLGQDWVKALDTNRDWVTLPVPDSKYGPGTILQLTFEAGDPKPHIRSRGNIKRFFPEAVKDNVFELEESAMPAMTFKSGKKFNAEALLEIFGFKPGINFSKDTEVTLDIQEYGAPIISLDVFEMWLGDAKNKDRFNTNSLKLFNGDNFVVAEALVVKKATFSLSRKGSGKIDLTGTNINDYISGTGKFENTKTTEGKLEVKSPIVFAVHYARRIPGEPWKILGKPGLKEPKADPLKPLFEKGVQIEDASETEALK